MWCIQGRWELLQGSTVVKCTYFCSLLTFSLCQVFFLCYISSDLFFCWLLFRIFWINNHFWTNVSQWFWMLCSWKDICSIFIFFFFFIFELFLVYVAMATGCFYNSWLASTIVKYNLKYEQRAEREEEGRGSSNQL